MDSPNINPDSQTNICRLCLGRAELSQSHVISEFFYQGIYDKNHKMNVVCADPMIPEKRPSKGLYERLLCARCEQFLNRNYEDYLSKLLAGKLTGIQVEDARNVFAFHNLDYSKTKLALLANLWRMHVSQREEFKCVNLGKYAEEIRHMLLSGIAASETRFGLVTTKPYWDHDDQPIDPFVTMPLKLKRKYNTIYRVTMGGLLFAFHVPGKQWEFPVSELPLLRENGTWVIMKGRLGDIPMLADMFGKWGQAMRTRAELRSKA